uniref:Uncharacterized protein n=1 Tax=Spongospora subterranea TaxID=70186 RepID=A0A0H5QSE0_9EUKA|eukprot:CRZ04943.1 hypothetical protein [Spongospora subterranea]
MTRSLLKMLISCYLVCLFASFVLGFSAAQPWGFNVRDNSFDGIVQYDGFWTDHVENPVLPISPSNSPISDLPEPSAPSELYEKPAPVENINEKSQFRFDTVFKVWVPELPNPGERISHQGQAPRKFLLNLRKYCSCFMQNSVPSELMDALVSNILCCLCTNQSRNVLWNPHRLQDMLFFIFNHDDDSLQSSLQFADQLNTQTEVITSPVDPSMKFSQDVIINLSIMSTMFRMSYKAPWLHPILRLFWNASLILLESYGASGKDVINALQCHIQATLMHDKQYSKAWGLIFFDNHLFNLLYSLLRCFAGARLEYRSRACISGPNWSTIRLRSREHQGIQMIVDALKNLAERGRRSETETAQISEVNTVNDALIVALNDFFKITDPYTADVVKSIVLQPDDQTLLANYDYASPQYGPHPSPVHQLPFDPERVWPGPVPRVLGRMSAVFQLAYCSTRDRPVLSLFWNAALKVLDLYGARDEDTMNSLTRHIQKNLVCNPLDSTFVANPLRTECVLIQYLLIILKQVVDNLTRKVNNANANTGQAVSTDNRDLVWQDSLKKRKLIH